MRVSRSELAKLNLAEAVQNSLKYGIEHFPPLASDECLSDAISLVAEQLRARLERNYPLPVETIGYPRKLFGIRPVAVSSLGTRALYKALAGKMIPYLPDPSRSDGAWPAHKEFGLKSKASHVVEFDIASCYEYVDHNLLLEELVVRTGDAGTPQLMASFLTELQGRQLGLPQLWYESDILADTYLDILARGLSRNMFAVSRFADDFRVLASSFEEASAVIEQASELARRIGLVLSTEKTKIYTRKTLAARHETDDDILSRYFADAEEAMAQAREFMMSGYDSDEDDDEEEIELDFAVYHMILQDWFKAADPVEGDPFLLERLQGLIPRILAVLRHAEEAVTPGQLAAIASDNQARVEAVVKYIAARMELERERVNHVSSNPFADVIDISAFSAPRVSENYWFTIKSIALNKRQNPWVKLWAIYAARIHASEPFDGDELEVMKWLDEQIDDRHELVRAEAAWALVNEGRTSASATKIVELYQRATDMTRPLLAAALSKVKSCPAGALKAVQSDGPLMKEAVEWAKKN
ncbi:Reverse transcriptase (RNA-dependent DNA polymerase) [Lentzea fradiae]|uniref:Reverse transcriptase (RNA-dependent DNA polymerase) n=1 Tax=Lentzea fradiae TaxID=200378 RepID=A0A1G7MID4_9PSEU|nr:reverse transcriptase domain-containing protein [Lentzea fradiae]SDF60909.1 Reverse transcriptase (RNA-dependent DNA polymerase) [Lentzea fradiae]